MASLQRPAQIGDNPRGDEALQSFSLALADAMPLLLLLLAAVKLLPDFRGCRSVEVIKIVIAESKAQLSLNEVDNVMLGLTE